jgi:hypothetical protein
MRRRRSLFEERGREGEEVKKDLEGGRAKERREEGKRL